MPDKLKFHCQLDDHHKTTISDCERCPYHLTCDMYATMLDADPLISEDE